MAAPRAAVRLARRLLVAGLAIAATDAEITHAAGAPVLDGPAIFNENCAACHQAGGIGAPGLAPSLVSKHIAAAGAKNPAYVVLVVLNGLSGQLPMDDGSAFAGVMPPVGLGMTDEQVAAVVGYVLGGLNGSDVSLTAPAVAELRTLKPKAKELRAIREELRP